MKYLILIMGLGFSGCTYMKDDTFKIFDCVVFKSGFYRGLRGVIEDKGRIIVENDGIFHNRAGDGYLVNLPYPIKAKWFDPKLLEGVECPKDDEEASIPFEIIK
jgi:hypothetical protein